ncbi:SSI family serine proteinase inhibitor [Geodermatophilus maliterrae]|uniref:SSI family serine proteinase inhibitor n=1 Tax=Geodermatophilus maliterrae TaxID=3162531 RepID=A0ABV3XGI6_9ACTN
MSLRTGPLLLLAALTLLCAACAERGGGGAPGTTGPGTVSGDELVVEVDRGDGSPLERYTLTCGEVPGGDHPDPRAACAHLAAMDDPFAPLAVGRLCTEQYGGPQTARVTGTWRGAGVDLALSRTDGCRISQWDSLGPLLPGPVG